MCHNKWHIRFMASMNIRELRDTKRLKEWLAAGRSVTLRERNRVIAHIVPQAAAEKNVGTPDFAAARRAVFGKRRLPGADLLLEERGRD